MEVKKKLQSNLYHIDIRNFWFGFNSQFIFAQHMCPHDIGFELGTWTLTYFEEKTVSGLIGFDFGVSTFTVSPIGDTKSCTNLDSESTCLVPETSVVGNVYTEEKSLLAHSYLQ